ncbi:MAG: carboxy terminal-processing peptidase [Gammaproteobacteria bacterium]|nr:carboxy terminal-processing peptidase [Gammaproteobacteria bacterium]MBU2072625.1 carboxy terminal-processing peptidase [Gammaproteobacteria bacterium]MBU2182241.1 carboxy terminal-processing peptidase [Gammaproteobacteria bacterium]MBU2204755.1 carboxy terminal-processing peptidase [Gammaproteobacteria bacterium]
MKKCSVLATALFVTFGTSASDVNTEPLVLPVVTQAAQHATASKRITALFTRGHYSKVQLDDALSSKMFDTYLKNLDYYRNVLTKADAASFEKYRTQFDDAINKGNLNLAFEMFNLTLQRRAERFDYALSLLESEFDFSVADQYVYDRENANWPADAAELNEIWRQRVKFDALNLKLAGKTATEIKDILAKRYRNTKKRLTQTESEDVFQLVMNSFARSIEAHTSYLSPRNADRFQQEMNLSLEGIGAVLRADEDYTVIQSLVPGGPADMTQKLKPKDKIIGVAQDKADFVDVIGWRLDDVVDLIKGPKGSTVRLQVVGANDIGTSQSQVISIVRDKIRLEDRAAKAEVFEPQLSELDQKIGVISIPGFYNNLAEDVKKLLAELKQANVDGIIVDLRGNGGGSLQEATLLTGLFIDRGPVVQIREGDGKVSVSQDNDGVSFYDGPLTIMVDRYSASASEIFAAAMQDYGRGLVVGEQTFGKGTVQQHRGLGRIYDMFDSPLGSVQYTIAKFYRINGGSTQHKGVIPDILFPTAIDPQEWGESKEEYALPWDSINAAHYDSLYDIGTLVPSLREKHQARINAEPEFQYLLEDIKEYKQNADDKIVSLKEAERVAERDDSKAQQLSRVNQRLQRLGMPTVDSLDDVPEKLEKIDPFLEEAANITADLKMVSRLAKK